MATHTKLIHGDAIEQMRTLDDKSIDLILTDLPYGVTRNKWDSVIPIPDMWDEFHRLCTGAIVLHSMQPFTTQLISSNLSDFRYLLVWVKEQGAGHLNAKRQPLRAHEDILVFYGEQPVYNPQMTFGHKPYRSTGGKASANYGEQRANVVSQSSGSRYPTTILKYGSDYPRCHPTQKPIALAEYLIRTYTNEGMTVLDCCMGSGTTGVAAVNTGRNFVGIERDEKWFEFSRKRIEQAAAAAVAA